jgi:hypothetical protein
MVAYRSSNYVEDQQATQRPTRAHSTTSLTGGYRIREVDQGELTVTQQVTVEHIVGIPVDRRNIAPPLSPRALVYVAPG